MAPPKPKFNPWPYFLFSICFLASMSYLSAMPYLGPLYDCTKLHDTSYFRLPDIINCSHDMHTSNDSLQFFKASVQELFLARTTITLFHCTAEIRAFKCHEKFFGSTSKDYSVKPLLVSDRACENAVKTHVSYFGPLFPQTYNTWTTHNNDHYSCSWMKTKTNHFKHFTVKAYHGELVGDIYFYISLLRMLSVITINSLCPSRI